MPGGKPARSARTRAAKSSPTPAPGPSIHPVTSPLDLLLRYQRRWADDSARFKIGLMARQVGKDFSSGAEGIRDCYAAELRGDKVTWMIGAPSERQALESFEKWKEWAEAFRVAIADYQEKREGGGSEALLKSATMTFPSGSRVIAVPGRPDTVRGFSANVLLTEFGFFEDPDATWRAVLPSITNPLRGGLKKIRLISTPNGQGNKFHDLWSKNYQIEGAKWSCHRVTIEDAVREGLPIDIDELRAAIDDPDGWAQEYLCEFVDTAAVLLSYDLLAAAENPQAALTQPPEFWRSINAEPIYLGIDFGRKRDLTVCWALVKVAGTYHLTREVLELARMPTDEQLEVLRPRIGRARRVAFDYTGPGIGLGDLLVKAFGEWEPQKDRFGRVELCTFTADLKQQIFSKLRMAFDQRLVGIPASRTLREDLHSVHRIVTPSGNVTYRAPHTADGHADRCTALALALRAAGTGGGTFAYSKVTPAETLPIG